MRMFLKTTANIYFVIQIGTFYSQDMISVIFIDFFYYWRFSLLLLESRDISIDSSIFFIDIEMIKKENKGNICAELAIVASVTQVK